MSDNDYDPQLQNTTGNHSPSAAQAADTLRTASKRLSEANDTEREPGMPLDTLALQLSCFEVGTLSGGLVSSAPE
jgi:hypothetical protein